MFKDINIHDVAREARVSASTVSNVLNGRLDRMRPETSERVLRAIEQLGYTTNQLARQFRTGRVLTIGLIVPSVANPFWGYVARSVEEAASAQGYQVLLCNAERDPNCERRYAETLLASGVRGVIFGSSPLSFDHLAALAQRGLQILAFDRRIQHADEVVVDSVGIDNVLGAKLATTHLIGLGHRRIGLLSGPIRTVSRQDRLKGYQKALQEADIEIDQQLIWEGKPISGFGDAESAELGRLGAHELLSLPNRPTALFAINDMYALGAYAGAQELGFRIPEDLSIVGFDDLSPFAAIATPPLTTVRQPIQQMMRIAVEYLIGRLEKTRSSPPEQLIAAPELIVRKSTQKV
ncbi:MAG: LacI family transcriptional regulator [Rubrobacteraceae bacterium]|nr:LacI family DNA-binding transcriptional regulator [Rubrobacteraceae bacterium]MCL6438704.1 LacI family transcriptional regulator [Rubrobacteraceae bacterium]